MRRPSSSRNCPSSGANNSCLAAASLQLNANDASAYETRGSVYDHLENFAAAVEDYTESIRLQPTSFKYWLRGRCYEMLREHGRSIADFMEAERLQAVERLGNEAQ